MALVLRDKVTYSVRSIFDDDDSDALVIRGGQDMYECKKLLLTASHAVVMLDPAELSEAHSQGSLKDVATKACSRQLSNDLLSNTQLLSCITVAGTKDNAELFLHLTTSLDGTEKERARNKLDRTLLRPLSFCTLRVLKANALAGVYAVDDASMKVIGKAFKLIPDNDLKKGDEAPFRVEVAEGPSYSKLEIQWKKYATNARATTSGEKRQREESLAAKDNLISFVDIPGSKVAMLVHVSSSSTVTTLQSGGLLIVDAE